jgi:hypothetical protein
VANVCRDELARAAQWPARSIQAARPEQDNAHRLADWRESSTIFLTNGVPPVPWGSPPPPGSLPAACRGLADSRRAAAHARSARRPACSRNRCSRSTRVRSSTRTAATRASRFW